MNRNSVRSKTSITNGNKERIFSVTKLKFIKNSYKLQSKIEDNQDDLTEYTNNNTSKTNVIRVNNSNLKQKSNLQLSNELYKKPFLSHRNNQTFRTQQVPNELSNKYNTDTINSNFFVQTESSGNEKNTLSTFSNLTSPLSRRKVNSKTVKLNPGATIDPLKSVSELRRNDKSSTIKNINSYPDDAGEKLNNNFNIAHKYQEDEVEHQKRDINEVAKLNHWEKEVLLTDESEFKKQINVRDLNNAEVESLNYLNHIRSSLTKLNMKNVSHQLQEFFNQSEKEQGSILLQNINFPKKEFNFDLLLNANKKEKIGINNFNTINYENRNKKWSIRPSYINEEDKNQSLKLFSNLEKDEALQNYDKLKNEGKIEKLSKVDDYRHIMKEKVKIESSFYKELTKVAQQIFEKKIERMKTSKVMSEIISYIKSLKEQFIIDDEKLAEYIENLEKYRQINLGNHNNIHNSDKVLRNADCSILSQNGKYHVRNKSNTHLLNDSIASIRTNYKNEQKNNINEEDKFKIETDLQKQITEKQEERNQKRKEYESYLQKYTTLAIEKSRYLEKLESEIKNLKFVLNSLSKDQRTYYSEILKKGIDVRTDGLTWAVKKLIELNTHLDYSCFPRFLDHAQIDYLLTISYKFIESTQLKIILKSLKMRKSKKNEEEKSELFKMKTSLNSFFQKSGTNFISTLTSNMANDKYDTHILAQLNPFYTRSFSAHVLALFENIFKNNDSMMKVVYEQRVQEASVELIVEDLKKKIKVVENDENLLEEIEQDTNSIMRFFTVNQEQKDQFEEIIYLRDKIREIDLEIISLREEEIKKFRKRYESILTVGSKHRVAYDLVFAALFGNSIIL